MNVEIERFSASIVGIGDGCLHEVKGIGLGLSITFCRTDVVSINNELRYENTNSSRIT